MEKSLLVNDFPFVSKSTVWPRLPNTPIAMPFLYIIPFPSSIPSRTWNGCIFRIPAGSREPRETQRRVVFNFPVNDTLINDEVNFGSRVTYYEAVRKEGRDRVWQDYGDLIITRPVDKRENFIKRCCVGIAGDTIQIIKANST